MRVDARRRASTNAVLRSNQTLIAGPHFTKCRHFHLIFSQKMGINILGECTNFDGWTDMAVTPDGRVPIVYIYIYIYIYILAAK